MNQQHIDRIAKVCHEANRAYCESIGDQVPPSWEDAPDWQKDSLRNGVKFNLANPTATPAKSHESWLAQKEAEGWVYGPEKNVELKQHPCMVPYDQLPQAQRSKDFLFRSIVHSMHNAAILMSNTNPEGWKLEELLDQLVGEVRHKTSKIEDDTREIAQAVVRNNDAIIAHLTEAAKAQRNSYEILAQLGPNEGPLGTPRIGVGSQQ